MYNQKPRVVHIHRPRYPTPKNLYYGTSCSKYLATRMFIINTAYSNEYLKQQKEVTFRGLVNTRN